MASGTDFVRLIQGIWDFFFTPSPAPAQPAPPEPPPDPVPPPVADSLRPELREAFEASWERNEAGYRYLAQDGKD